MATIYAPRVVSKCRVQLDVVLSDGATRGAILELNAADSKQEIVSQLADSVLSVIDLASAVSELAQESEQR